MIEFNTYNFINMWIRYYFEKFLPPCFYPLFLKYQYRKFYKYFNLSKNLDLKNPKLFSEKLNYLKIYDVTPLKTLLTDKLEVKKYIKEHLPELKTAKVYQVCSSFDELDFSKCPKKFIIKTNHACKTGILIEDKNNITKENLEFYKKYYKKVLKMNYAFYGTLELQYKNIKPKIYTEEYIENDNLLLLKEYEVYCINGKPELISLSLKKNRYSLTSYYNSNWERADYALFYTPVHEVVESTVNKTKIIEYAKILSKDFKFVRVDFFEANNILYFAEMTFTPFSANIKFKPEEYDKIWGEKLKI